MMRGIGVGLLGGQIRMRRFWWWGGVGKCAVWPVGLDTIFRHQFFRTGIILEDAGGGDGFAFLNLGGDFQVQGEELGEQILLALKP